ncbi:MAG: geranylgeranylglyceryl/heptaprenylglyceryl phosphate synthase [Candidatus Bathyarchaeia archaeon]|jgi:phosphoglycerol geranylgeranyltransferase
MLGRVEQYLIDSINKQGAIHLTLLDPEKVTRSSAKALAKAIEKSGSAAIMIGGSTAVSVYHTDEVISAIKKQTKLPVIIFPNDLVGISREADAIFFMSLMNSMNPYYITHAQALGAPLVKRYGLEPIPMGYVIVGDRGAAAAFVGQANPIPFEKPSLAVIYGMAAQFMGKRFFYLEAGSGVERPISLEMVAAVSEHIEIPLVVGGGIRSPKVARQIVKAGARVIVTGTLVEKASPEVLRRVVRSIMKAA